MPQDDDRSVRGQERKEQDGEALQIPSMWKIPPANAP